MESLKSEKEILTQHLVQSISDVLKDYSEQYPCSKLSVSDVRGIIAKIIDYLDIAEITGFNPWER